MKDKLYRKQLFLHLDGIVVISNIAVLNKIKILELIKSNQSFTAQDICTKYKTNLAYLNVSLRTLLSIGIIDISKKEKFKLNKKYLTNSKHISIILKYMDNIILYNSLIPIYLKFHDLLNPNYDDIKLDEEIKTFNFAVNNLKILKINLLNESNSDFEKRLYYYFEGMLLGPLICAIGYHKILINNSSTCNVKTKNLINDIFLKNNFIDLKNNFTERGDFFIKRSASYGVTVSYLPIFNNLETILISNKNFIWERDKKGIEKHVDRGMNVWGSGGSHKYYFKKIDDIIINIFNQDIKSQPKGIVDMGCGDGTFLKHCYDIIMQNTIRKEYIDTHPLLMVGADINRAARVASRKKLNKSNINNLIINGNISDPLTLNKSLIDEYGLKLIDFISTRTFLDHNRIYIDPKEIKYKNILSSGVFCFKGTAIDNDNLINNLIEHFSSWKRYIKKYGLIILELHTIDPDLTFKNQGETLACSYDCTHGFSDQYLVEYDIFIKCAKVAKLKLVNKSNLFPNSQIPTISINYFI